MADPLRDDRTRADAMIGALTRRGDMGASAMTAVSGLARSSS